MTRLRALVLALSLSACATAVLSSAALGAPDPMSDADGDGIPYAWETNPATTTPPVSKKCGKGKVRKRGKCVKKKCKKGKKLKRGKCVKKKKGKKKGKHRGGKARASAVAPATVAPLGANPDHKDIFVQIDYASAELRGAMACGELDKVVAAFAGAPVGNPDGATGIDLHIDAGIVCPSRSYDLGGSKVFETGSACPNTSQIFNADQLPESRVGTFHIAGFGPLCGSNGEGGAATLHGSQMAIFTSGQLFGHVLMHELGHNLGLDHQLGFQPNRFSDLNSIIAVSATGNGYSEKFDYNRIPLPALDENALSEEAGVSAPPALHDNYVFHHCPATMENPLGYQANSWPGNGAVDWNCNSPQFGPPTIDPGTVSADINGDGQLTVLPATVDEWAILDYASGGQIGPH